MLHYDVKCVPLHSLINTEMGIQGVQRLAETLKVNRALEVVRYSVEHWVLGSTYIGMFVIQPHALNCGKFWQLWLMFICITTIGLVEIISE